MSEKSELAQQVAVRIVEKRNGRMLADNEKRFVLGKIKNINLNLFKDKPRVSVVAALSDMLCAELENLPKEKIEGPLDIKSMLYDQMGPDHKSGKTKKAYLLLDRKYLAGDTNNSTEFRWFISTTAKKYNPELTAALTAPIRDITSIRMLPFVFPNTDDTIHPFRRLHVEIIEANMQAYLVTSANRRFHFSFNIERAGTLLPYNITDAGNSESRFDFAEPIIELDTITLRFSNIDSIISLDPDRLFGVIAAVGAQTQITFDVPHRCAVGSIVVISGFSTDAPVADSAEIELMNESVGWPIVSVTTFTILLDLDLSGLVGNITGAPFEVYLNAKRFAIQLEITHMSE